MASLEKAFARFCRSGDPRALAVVFDRTAAELFRVATHLVGDPDVAEDLVQSAFLVAIEERATFQGKSKVLTWLTGILTNKAREARRAMGRRPDPARIPAVRQGIGPLQTAEAEELGGAVSDAIARLPEPYRPVLTLHLSRGMGAHDIALELVRPPGTVRTQLMRGLEMLRRKLPAGLAVGVASVSAGRGLAAVRDTVLQTANKAVPAGVSTGVAVGGALIMKNILLVSTGIISLGAVAWITWPEADPVPESGNPSVAERGVSAPAASGPGTAVEPGAPARRVPVSNTGEPETAEPPRWHGRVLDPTARPVAGVAIDMVAIGTTGQEVESTFRRPVAESDADGSFSFAAVGLPSRISVGSDFVMLRGPVDNQDPLNEILIVVAPAGSIAGIVSDSDGMPLADVAIETVVRPLADFPLPLDPTVPAEFAGATTDATGRFSLEGLPAEQSRLAFRKPGYTTANLAVSAGRRNGESIVLRPLEEGRYTLGGTVIGPRGELLVDARVGIGRATTSTDRYGEYLLELDDSVLEEKRPLVVSKAGIQTFVLHGARSLFSDRPDARLDIGLEGTSLELGGRVVGPDGHPVSGVHVRLWMEEFVVGTETAADLALEGIAARRDEAGNPRVYAITDAEGVFSLQGLQDKEYQVRLRDANTWLAWTEGPFRAGRRDLELTVPADSIVPELRGRIVGGNGQPIEGVRLGYSVQVHRSPVDNSWSSPGRIAFTDADGRFLFEDVPAADQVCIVATGEDVVAHAEFLSKHGPFDDIVITLERRCNFRIELAPGSPVVRFELRDRSDEPLLIWEHRGGTQTSRESIPLTDGRTPVYAASERARTVLLIGADGEVVDRVPVALVPGQVTVVGR